MDGAETVGQFFGGVAVMDLVLSRVTSCPWEDWGLRLHFSTPRRMMLWDGSGKKQSRRPHLYSEWWGTRRGRDYLAGGLLMVRRAG